MPTDTLDDIWVRLLGSADGDMTPDAARYVLQLDFAHADRERIAALSEAANEGLLSTQERAELDKYIRVGHQLSLLKSRARSALKGVAAGTASDG
jgi:hypothetical protein